MAVTPKEPQVAKKMMADFGVVPGTYLGLPAFEAWVVVAYPTVEAGHGWIDPLPEFSDHTEEHLVVIAAFEKLDEANERCDALNSAVRHPPKD